MKNTYQISRVKVALPPLGKVTHDDQGNAISLAEEYQVHLYAVKPGWEQHGTFDGFMVGCAVGSGSSSSEYNITRDVIVPDGHKIIALRIGDNNQPVSWESLPVEFVGGYLPGSDTSEFDKKMEAALQVINTTDVFKKLTGGKLEGDYTINVGTDKDGKRYAAGMAVGVDASTTKTRLSADMRDAVIDAVRESGLFAELTPQKEVVFQAERFTVTSGAVEPPHNSNVITVNINTQHNDEELSAAIAKAIKTSLRPGGLIHGSVQKR